MNGLESAPSIADSTMEVSVSTVTEKEDVKEISKDSEESKENHLTTSMDFTSEVVQVTETKSNGSSESTNREISNETSDSANQATATMETSNETNDILSQAKATVETSNEQLIDKNVKNGNQIDEDNSMASENEVSTIESKLNDKCSRNSENNILQNAKENSTTENSNSKTDLFFIDNCSSLHAIAAEYDSSDSENENENKNGNKNEIKNDSSAKISNANVYRNVDEVVITDSDSSDSDSDSSSSDSESESDNAGHKNSNDDSDEETPRKTKSNKPVRDFKVKGEFDDLPPIEDLKISVPEVLCDPLGEVAWTVEQMVVVRPKPGKPTLNLDTVLFIDKGQRALGHIFDVFGQVTEPHYCVRFNSSDHIRECDIKVGMTVYYCPNTQYTTLVFLSELTKMKAVDDIGDDEAPQFSDDEEEQAYLASLKNNQNNKNVQESSSENPHKRKRVSKSGWQSNHPWNSNKEHQQNVQPHNTKPFYRTHHPWSRPRFPPQQQWRPYNFYPNQWMGQYPPYNQMQPYNQYFGQPPTQLGKMPNQFPQGQWNPHYQLPQLNTLPLQGAPPTFAPPYNFPPPPPPPPSTSS